MIIVTVISLLGLPIAVGEGTSMVFYIGFAAILFRLPALLVTATQV